MSPRPRDTAPEIWDLRRDALRAMGPEGRLRVAVELSEAVRQLRIQRLLRRHSDWTQAQAIRRLVFEDTGIELPARP